MTAEQLHTFATDLLASYALTDWSFGYNGRKRAQGICRYQHRRTMTDKSS